MESFNKQKWEELNLSRDEVKNLGEALQKEEFRNLLLEYVKEINDPENRKQYEKEITQLENERGVDIKFVHPSSGYVIKTSVDGVSKAFINICSNTNVGKPSSNPDVNGSQRGLRWSIPYCLAPPREDVDKKNSTCTVFDVIFHPDTLHMTKSNGAFRNLVNDTALGAVEENFHVSLDKINLKFPKMQFKGMKHATVIRKQIQNFQPTEVLDLPNYPYPPVKEDNKKQEVSKTFERKEHEDSLVISNKDAKYAMPKYSIKYRNNIDMQDYTNDLMSKMSITVPNELVVVIDLPLLKHASDASVDVSEKLITLLSDSPAKYKLQLKLPYRVDSSKGNAKFDISKKVLTITLPVIRQGIHSNIDAAREDSGVECDNYGRTNSISSDDEVEKNPISERITKVVSKTENMLFEKETKICDLGDGQFLQQNIHYSLPSFTCQYLKDILSFTLQVPNVNPESVKHHFVNDGVHISFQSVGAGYFPINYAMYILLQYQTTIERESIKVEVWDNNVIVLLKLNYNVCLKECYVGVDQNNLKKIKLSRISLDCEDLEKDLKLKEKCTLNGTSENTYAEERNITHTRSEEGQDDTINNPVQVNNPENESDDAHPTHFLSQESDENQDLSKGNKAPNEEDTDEFFEEGRDISESASSFDESSSSPRHHPVKTRTMSESHQEDLMRSKNRGILKIGRSLSESSVDDYASWSPEKMEKTKKTVRFSEVISKHSFRMNSSILGQRKKNQRKMRNKKRSLERRLSESGNDSEGESDLPFFKGNYLNNKEGDIWLADPDSSSCDVSEVSDISESDDGQKGDVKPMPCSSKKNHKRRGKKSARKNAATAKIQFMDN
uniref:Protein kintoun n=1 Tax=Cuerna arida TaxID=1464854 RepID=A0A1B6F2W4_9HEMI